MHNNHGFTFLELLIAVAVVAILGTIGMVSFSSSRNVRDLNTSTQNVFSILRLAQSNTLAGESDSRWGVRLQSNQITLFAGETFIGATYTQIYSITQSIQITGISLAGGGNDIIFKRITGKTDQTGTFVLQIVANPANSIILTVSNSGNVYETTPFPAPITTRTIDVRHRLFTLEWSIKNSNTLTLTFENPSYTEDIPMVSFFDLDKTKFDWSNTITVGGIDQVLRIHTTSLTDTNTILSVDRDCRRNNKQLTIAIDTKPIAIYTADCANVSAGAFGGIISEP